MSTTEHDQWLAANTFECQRFGAKISKVACAKYQAENQSRTLKAGLVNSGKKILLPGCCQGCPQVPAGQAKTKSGGRGKNRRAAVEIREEVRSNG